MLFSIVATPIYIPTKSAQGFSFLHILVNTCWYVVLVTQSHPTLVTLWTITHQAPLSMEFSRQEYWSGLPFPSPQHLLPLIFFMKIIHSFLFLAALCGLWDLNSPARD